MSKDRVQQREHRRARFTEQACQESIRAEEVSRLMALGVTDGEGEA